MWQCEKSCPRHSQLDSTNHIASDILNATQMHNTTTSQTLLLSHIRDKVKECFGYHPCLWQIHMVQALLKNDNDIVSILATGSGKSLTFWMPLLFILEAVQIIIMPLNILGRQNVETLGKVGIQAIMITGLRHDLYWSAIPHEKPAIWCPLSISSSWWYWPSQRQKSSAPWCNHHPWPFGPLHLTLYPPYSIQLHNTHPFSWKWLHTELNYT